MIEQPLKLYWTHRAMAQSIHLSAGIPMLVAVGLNEALRHCRIGKITIKPLFPERGKVEA